MASISWNQMRWCDRVGTLLRALGKSGESCVVVIVPGWGERKLMRLWGLLLWGGMLPQHHQTFDVWYLSDRGGMSCTSSVSVLRVWLWCHCRELCWWSVVLPLHEGWQDSRFCPYRQLAPKTSPHTASHSEKIHILFFCRFRGAFWEGLDS
jgi:hypothetical protein